MRVLIIHENQKTIEKLKRTLDEFQDWEIYSTAPKNFSLTRLNKIFAEEELHILIFAKNLDPQATLELRGLHLNFPQTIIVYYYSHLKHRQFINLYEEGVHSCIVGTSQQLTLVNTLKNLWKNHWKRISDSLLPASRDDLSVYEILNYQNLSGYSRSVKGRHGETLRDILHNSDQTSSG